MKEEITIKKSMIYFPGIIILIIVLGYFMLQINGTNAAENIVQGSKGDVQKIILGMKNYNYYPDTITVKSGKPVSISLDSSVSGCLRSFSIRDFGVSKYARTPSETIDFVPTKKGTFGFSCSMGMGFGKIIVE